MKIKRLYWANHVWTGKYITEAHPDGVILSHYFEAPVLEDPEKDIAARQARTNMLLTVLSEELINQIAALPNPTPLPQDKIIEGVFPPGPENYTSSVTSSLNDTPLPARRLEMAKLTVTNTNNMGVRFFDGNNEIEIAPGETAQVELALCSILIDTMPDAERNMVSFKEWLKAEKPNM